MRFVVVGLGGVLGALSRYGINGLLNERGMLPWGTLAANLLGCFLLALCLTVALCKFSGRSYLVLAVATGFIGSLTTFSTLSVEGVMLWQAGYAFILTYIGATLLGGYALVWAGYLLGQYIINSGLGRRWLEGMESNE